MIRSAPKNNPNDVSEFLARVNEIRDKLFDSRDDPNGPWFRGQARSYWKLCPRLFRDYEKHSRYGAGEIEDEIREEFAVRAPILSDMKPAGEDDWEWYFLMQHYGAPTRLLDWTEGSLLGLYFAVKDNPGYYDAAVWMLDPYELNWKVIRSDEVIPPSAPNVTPQHKKLVTPWLQSRFRKNPSLPPRPVAVFPTHIARRISTQRSCFTVHGSDSDGLDKFQVGRRACLVKIIIPSYRVRALQRELEACGIDEATIFPDLDGLGRSLSSKWKEDHHRLPHCVFEVVPSENIGTLGIRLVTQQFWERAETVLVSSPPGLCVQGSVVYCNKLPSDDHIVGIRLDAPIERWMEALEFRES